MSDLEMEQPSASELAKIRRAGARTCPGDCCFGFTLGNAEGRARVEQLARETPTHHEARQIAAMVIPLGPHPVNGHPSYTCKNWDPRTRLCTIYETRPKMCRDYPYGGECEFGCPFRSEPAGVAS